MDSQEIIDGNKLMATFMGYSYYPHPEKDPGWRTPNYSINRKDNGFLARKHSDIRYYNDWNWMTKVVERIESLPNDSQHGRFGVYISGNGCTIQGTYLHLALENPKYGYVYYRDYLEKTKLISTWIACRDFILWYNEKENGKVQDKQ